MESKKPLVFLTGGTGVMGQAAVEALSHHLDKINLRLLIHERKIPNVISTIINQNKSTIETINGDLRDYNTIYYGVKNNFQKEEKEWIRRQ